MDIRVIKSKNAIKDAFLDLRKKKTLKNITVKELCEKAMVNKSTFYSHYTDIFDLTDKLENEIIFSIVNSISHPDYIFENNANFTKELINAFSANSKIIDILFPKESSSMLAEKTILELKEIIYKKYPNLRHNQKATVALNYAIYGSYYAFKDFVDSNGQLNAESEEALFNLTNIIGIEIRKYIAVS